MKQACCWAAILTATLTFFPFDALAQDDDGPMKVVMAPLADLMVGARQSVSAEVVPRNRSLLAAEVAARVRRVAADVGTRVAKGQLLVELDPTLYKLALKRAEANLAGAIAEAKQAAVTLARVQKLATRDFASEDELEIQITSQAVLARTVEQNRVAVAEAQDALQRTQIKAPFDGVIEARTAQVGAYVLPGDPLVTLTEVSGREVNARLSPEDTAALADASRIEFQLAGTVFPVKVLRITEVIDQQSRQQTVRFGFVENGARVGSTGRVFWEQERELIPASYVIQRKGKLGVFTVIDERAVFVPLPSARQGRPAAHDLPANTLIVTEGRARLTDGTPVADLSQ